MSVHFSEAEMLILSSLAYTNDIPKGRYDSNGYPIDKDNPVSVDSILKGLDKLAMGKDYEKSGMSNADKDNYEAAIASLKSKLKENHFVISKSINHNSSGESGFAAFAIEPYPNPDGEVVICCRGSDAMNLNPFDKKNTLNDWFGADLALAWDEQTKQQEEIKKFMEGFESYHSITLTGHSLGANLAMYAAVTYPYPNKILGVYAFDGPGFNLSFIKEYHEEISRISDKIYNYQQEHDFVSSSLKSIGNVIILDSTIDYNGGVNFDHHNRWAIGVNPDGKLRREISGKKDNVCNAWSAVSTGVSAGISAVIKDVIFVAIYSYATSFCKQVANGVKAFLDKHFNQGYKYASGNTYIKVDTGLLRSYADRLAKANNRITKLDRRMDSLYTKVGLFDLWDLLQADALTGYSWRLSRCINYLNDTANEFDSAERSISSQL